MPSKADREKYKRSLAYQAKNRTGWEKLADLPVQRLSNTDGKIIVAKITYYDGEAVTLKMRGKSYRYPMDNLSAGSRKVILDCFE